MVGIISYFVPPAAVLLAFGWTKVSIHGIRNLVINTIFFLSATSVTELNDRSEVYVINDLQTSQDDLRRGDT